MTRPQNSPVHYQEVARDGHARAGVFQTKNGQVLTPAFMPVGTQATVKALSAQEVSDTGASMTIMNTDHLWLRPGAEIVKELGGLHKMAGWKGAIATDSGGFQAFSLAARTKLSEEGFRFSSHLDGKRLLLSPEEAMRVQGALGSDVAMQLDVCLPGQTERSQLVDALERTTRWGRRCLDSREEGQAVFGIVQGGTDIDLRLRHIEELSAMEFDGVALGGFSVGEPPEKMHHALGQVAHRMDGERIRYLMGVGTPRDLVIAIGAGIDLFDCVMPTRNARNGQVFVPRGKLVIKNSKFKTDSRVIEEGCDCPACAAGLSRGYLRHLYVAGEILVHRLLSLHNLRFYARLVADAREAILAGDYERWSKEKLREFQLGAE
ncbi:MAG: tRNA guanosine(34) transglycosylase Tgt [Polyangiaceae bacterium]|nr:tRNA guanosine(34) transglycosylase Tgt [Polyangiaceae bacterium]